MRITQDQETYVMDMNYLGAKRHTSDRLFFTIFIIKNLKLNSEDNPRSRDIRQEYELSGWKKTYVRSTIFHYIYYKISMN